MDDTLNKLAEIKAALDNGGADQIRQALTGKLSAKDAKTLVRAILQIGGAK